MTSGKRKGLQWMLAGALLCCALAWGTFAVLCPEGHSAALRESPEAGARGDRLAGASTCDNWLAVSLSGCLPMFALHSTAPWGAPVSFDEQEQDEAAAMLSLGADARGSSPLPRFRYVLTRPWT